MTYGPGLGFNPQPDPPGKIYGLTPQQYAAWMARFAPAQQRFPMQQQKPALGAVDGKTVLTGVIIVGVVGLFGWLIYNSVQERKRIIEKEGSSGLLKYELGSAAIGVGSALTHRLMDSGRARRNPRRRRAMRRTR